MPLLTIHHKTEYRYAHPVAFGEHRIMLRPRDGHDLRVLSSNLEIVPQPMSLRWIHDVFGNSVAIATFDERAETLSFTSTATVEHNPAEEFALTAGRSGLFLSVPLRRRGISRPRSVHHAAIWRSRMASCRRGRGIFSTRKGRRRRSRFCRGMTHGIREAFTYRKRHEQGTQHPLDTLQTGSGTCRDYALFMIEALRRLGIAARFVSGYLSIPGDRAACGYVGGGSTHAWVQVYLPSAGWIEFDPTNGIVGTRDLIRVAVARDPRQAIPLHGTYLGSADAFVGMEVSINVVSVPTRERWRPDHGDQGRLRDRLRRGAADADGDHALAFTPRAAHDIIGTESIVAEPDVPIGFYRDSFGNICGRLVAPAGGVTLRGSALVRDSGLPDVVAPDAQQLPIEQLPDDVLLYLMASRYCETDKLTDIAWSLFGNTRPGWARVAAICNFVHNHVTFGYQHAHHMKSAHDVYEQRAGVCRDFAHLALTFCRCMGIPARYCTGYMGDIGIPPDPEPMDFSGWFEAYLSGQWYTFDARHNHPRIGRILMGTGRDAADVALTTSFGRMNLTKFVVISDEVAAA